MFLSLLSCSHALFRPVSHVKVMEESLVTANVTAADIWIVPQPLDLLILDGRDKHFFEEFVATTEQNFGVVHVVEGAQNGVRVAEAAPIDDESL